MQKLSNDRMEMKRKLIEAIESSEQASQRAEEWRIRQQGLEELLATLKSGDHAKRISEWQDKMQQLRLSEMTLSRESRKFRKQVCASLGLPLEIS